ncbi:RNA-directed DNA polymerase [Gimesia aquarii]|nr:RNA-directed DNA polymerase [Gimesia aquarii]
MRRVQTRSEWRYFKYRTLKEIEKDGTPTYRECIAGSPTTLIAEAYVLSMMAQEQAFAPPANVYSYQWPRSDRGGRNFQYYQHGFARRNYRITELLRKYPSHVAIVGDIRRFYPSVRWTFLEPIIQKRLAKVESVSDRRIIGNFLMGMKPNSGSGIPIGTDVSHVLGNIALETLDEGLATEFGDSYFRYVDDIVIVCPAEDRDRVTQKIRSYVRNIDLKMHEGKDDVVDSSTWVSNCPVIPQKPVSGSFEALLHDICIYLFLWPHYLEPLQKAFVSEGFTIPFGRLVTQSKYRPYRHFARSLLRKNGWYDVPRLFLTKVQGLIAAAKKVRETLISTLRELGSRKIPAEGMQRRWFVQQCRYNINRLLYLFSPAEYSKLLEKIPDGQEFAEYRILLGVLISSDVTDILQLPGHVLATFCELASEQNPPEIPVTIADLRDRSIAESVTMLALYFGWKVPDSQSTNMFRGSKMLLEICSGGISRDNLPDEMSYLDELELLYRDVPQAHLAKLARTRFAEGEEIGLEGLLLGGGYGVS